MYGLALSCLGNFQGFLALFCLLTLSWACTNASSIGVLEWIKVVDSRLFSRKVSCNFLEIDSMSEGEVEVWLGLLDFLLGLAL